MRTIGTIIIVIVTTIFCLNVDALPTIGDINSAPNQHITPTYIEDGQHDTGSPNLVTAVLADYRGFDTLGETSVMFVAGLTAVLILKEGKNDKHLDKKKGGGSK